VSTQGSTANYVEVSSQAYTLIVDVLGKAVRRRLGYWKSVWEVVSRPYTSTAIDSVVRENFDRANQLSDLTVAELRARGENAAEFSEKFLYQVEKLQDAGVEALRDSLQAYVSTVDKVKEAAASPVNGSKPKDKAANLVSASN